MNINIIVRIIQFIFYFSSLVLVVLFRNSNVIFPCIILLVGMQLRHLLPKKYRSGFFSDEKGLILKNKTMKKENIFEMIIIILVSIVNLT